MIKDYISNSLLKEYTLENIQKLTGEHNKVVKICRERKIDNCNIRDKI